MLKKNIALVTGGYSGEASIKSAAIVERNLDKNLYEVYTILIGKNSWKYKDVEVDRADFTIMIDGIKIMFDAVFNCIHGSPGEDGKLQGYFDMIDLPFIGGNTITMALTFNKSFCNKVVSSLDVVNVAKSIHLFKDHGYNAHAILEQLKLPVFVKPAEQGESIGVSKVTVEEDLDPAIQKAFKVDNQILVETFIKGRELTCGVYSVNGIITTLPITEVISAKGFFDYEAKHTPGLAMEVTPAKIPEDITAKVQKAAASIYEKLNCKSMVRIDFIYEEETGKVFFLEINTIPGQREDSIIPMQVRAMGGNLTDFYTLLLEDILKDKVEDQKKGNQLLKEFHKIQENTEGLYEGIIKTPCMPSSKLSNLFGLDLYLKKEYQQVTGSFKARGSLFALQNLSDEEKKNGVITASTGNHAVALAYHGMRLGIPVMAVVPEYAPSSKKAPAERYGAEMIVYGENMKEAKNYAKQLARENNMKYIDAFDDPFVMYGQGTVAMEALEQVPDVEAILVPIGGGGLLAGTTFAAKTLNPDIQVIGIKPKPANVEDHKPDFPLPEGLVSPYSGGNALQLVESKVDKIIEIDQDEVARAMLLLAETDKIVVEGSGALTIAALLSGKLGFLKEKRVVAVLTGGNIDMKTMSQALDRGLFVDGRLTKVKVTIPKQGIKNLITLITDLGTSIRDMKVETIGKFSRRNDAVATIFVECTDYVQARELQNTLNLKYKQVSMEVYHDLYEKSGQKIMSNVSISMGF